MNFTAVMLPEVAQAVVILGNKTGKSFYIACQSDSVAAKAFFKLVIDDFDFKVLHTCLH